MRMRGFGDNVNVLHMLCVVVQVVHVQWAVRVPTTGERPVNLGADVVMGVCQGRSDGAPRRSLLLPATSHGRNRK